MVNGEITPMGRRERIRFRCWYCNRKHAADPEQIGEARVCNCGERYRVPRRDGISRRAKTPLDWVLEFVIYGLGGGFLAGLIGLAIAARMRTASVSARATPIIVFGGAGLLVGALFGERGINFIGRLFDDRRTPGD